MKTTLPMIAVAALTMLSACGKSETGTNGDGAQGSAANAQNAAELVELPPMVKQSKTYRCKDGSLIYVDYMTDDKVVMLRTHKEGIAIKLTSEGDGAPFTAESGYSLTGPGSIITVEMPDKGSQSCKS